MTLVERLTAVRAKLGAIPVDLGVPQNQQKVVLLLNGQYTLLQPNPRVDVISGSVGGSQGSGSYRVAGLGNLRAGDYLTDSVQIMGDEWVVQGIPRSYPLELLQEARWLLNATQASPGVWSGDRATCLWVDKNLTVTWTAILAPRGSK